jgi:hypothetical protein
MKISDSFSPVVVIPVYKSFLDKVEKENLEISKKTNPDANYILYTHCECNLDIFEEILKSFTVRYTNKNNLSSISSYNNMMKSTSFYEEFLEFEFMLILQADAVLVKNIDTIRPENYDFIGAPWYPPFRIKGILNDLVSIPLLPKRFLHQIEVGNGGLSIRRTKKFYKAAKMIAENKIEFSSSKIPEDVLFSFNREKLELNYPNRDFAKTIFIEKFSKRKLLLEDPYGYHALERYHRNARKIILKELLTDIA